MLHTPSLASQLTYLFDHARGLPEASYGDAFEIVNWPNDFQQFLEGLIARLSCCDDSSELEEVEEWLRFFRSHEVPQGLLTLVAKVLYDNPSTPGEEARMSLN